MTYIHSFSHIHTIHLSIAIRWGLSPFPHRLSAQWENTSLWCRAEIRTRACLTASRRSTNWAMPHHTEPRPTILSHAAPFNILLFYFRYYSTRHTRSICLYGNNQTQLVTQSLDFFVSLETMNGLGKELSTVIITSFWLVKQYFTNTEPYFEIIACKKQWKWLAHF